MHMLQMSGLNPEHSESKRNVESREHEAPSSNANANTAVQSETNMSQYRFPSAPDASVTTTRVERVDTTPGEGHIMRIQALLVAEHNKGSPGNRLGGLEPAGPLDDMFPQQTKDMHGSTMTPGSQQTDRFPVARPDTSILMGSGNASTGSPARHAFQTGVSDMQQQNRRVTYPGQFFGEPAVHQASGTPQQTPTSIQSQRNNSLFTSDPTGEMLDMAIREAATLGMGGMQLSPEDMNYSLTAASSPATGNMPIPSASASLYVKNLPPEADELMLYQKFSPHGALLSCKVQTDPITGKCRGVGFVNYVDQAAALKAMQSLHGTRISEGRQLHISLQAPRAVRAAAAAANAAAATTGGLVNSPFRHAPSTPANVLFPRGTLPRDSPARSSMYGGNTGVPSAGTAQLLNDFDGAGAFAQSFLGVSNLQGSYGAAAGSMMQGPSNLGTMPMSPYGNAGNAMPGNAQLSSMASGGGTLSGLQGLGMAGGMDQGNFASLQGGMGMNPSQLSIDTMLQHLQILSGR